MGVIEILIPVLILTSPIWIVLFLIMKKNKAERGYYWYTNKHFQTFWAKYSTADTIEFRNLTTTVTAKSRISYRKRWSKINLFINDIGIYWYGTRSSKKYGWFTIFDQSQQHLYDAPNNTSLQSCTANQQILHLTFSGNSAFVSGNINLQIKGLQENEIIHIATILKEKFQTPN